MKLHFEKNPFVGGALHFGFDSESILVNLTLDLIMCPSERGLSEQWFGS